MILYFPPNATAGFANLEVSTPRRLPYRPAKSIAIISFFIIIITPLSHNTYYSTEIPKWKAVSHKKQNIFFIFLYILYRLYGYLLHLNVEIPRKQ